MVGSHLAELKNINLSLTTLGIYLQLVYFIINILFLGKVIHNLSNGSKLPIPYRES